MPQQQILAVMGQLVAEGKAITTAAVRARLSTSVPLSELLALVSRYKQAPENLPQSAIEVTPALQQETAEQENAYAADKAQLTARLAALEQVVAEQALKLSQLEALLMSNLAKPNLKTPNLTEFNLISSAKD